MKLQRILKAAVAGSLTVAIVGGGVLGLAGASFAAGSAPAWEPDGNAAAPYGNLTFYDSNGNEVTAGTGDLSSPFAYVVAGTAADSGATKASVVFYNPQHGLVPASWTGTAEAGPTVFSPSLSGAPTDVAAYAPTYPVVAASSADVSTWLASNVLDTTTGYANTIQVRMTDAGPHGAGTATGSYWESDIGYNTTSSPITVDGTTVPADGWAVLFPLVTGTTTSLTTTATGGNLTSDTPITLTATVPSGDAGTVQFYDGSTILGDVTPSAGSAAYTYTPTEGSHSYTASFVPALGDETGAYSATAGILGGSTSTAVVVSDTAPQTGTTTALVAGSNSIAYGASDTFTATVGASDNSAAGVTGAVEFLNGSSAITGCTAQATTVTGSGTVGSPGVGTATCVTTSLPAGSDSITAVFTPTSSSYATSTSSAVGVTVSQTGTTTALAASSTSIAAGASDTFTATVGATDNSTTGVTGSVAFLDGTNAIAGCTAQATAVTGSGTVGSPGVGTATCATTSLPAGSDSITAVFTPTSSSYATSTSSVVGVTVSQTGTTTALSATSNIVADGASDTFTATVGATDNSTTGVTGSVAFLDGTNAIAGCTAQATAVTGSGTVGSPGVGTATCSTSFLLAGSDSITAVFTPTSSSYATSTSPAGVITAAQTGTVITLSPSSNSPSYGGSETFTATVGAADNSTTGVTGSVAFLDGTNAIASCTAQTTTVTGAGTTGSPGVGTATCATSSLPVGSDGITAVFTPTNNTYATLSSPPVGVTVGEASSTTTFILSSSWITYGDEETEVLSVSVSPEFAGSTPAGTVTVTDSGSTLCAIALSGAKGSCTLSANQLGVGSYYNLTASYGGSIDFANSSYLTAESLTVAPASSTTTLSTSIAKLTYGNEGAESLSVRVLPEFSGSTPSGIVMIRESRTTLCAITLSRGAGSCHLSERSLPVGSYGLVATYSGSLNLNTSDSTTEGLKVSKATSKVALKLSPSTVTFGHETSEHISVNVSPEFAGSMPSGKVTVKISSRTLCVISLSSSGTGSCTLSAKKLSPGTYRLVASYSGSADLGTSSSPKETLKVVN